MNTTNNHLSILASNKLYEDDELIIFGKQKNQSANFPSQIKESFKRNSWDLGREFSGNWWFCIHEKITNKTKIIRDKHGYTCLFFAFKDRVLHISENIADILELKKYNFNYKKIAHFMAQHFSDDFTETFFENIHSLPAGFEVIINRGHLIVDRYWYPENVGKRLYKNKNVYYDEFLAIFQNAISKCILNKSNIATQLSGGLDSSSVNAITATLLKKQEKTLTSYTHIPLFPNKLPTFQNKFCDESVHVKETLKYYKNINGKLLNSSHVSPITGIKKWVDITNTIYYGADNSFWLYDIMNSVKENGHDLLLTGENGNATISYSGMRQNLNWNDEFWQQNLLRLAKHKIYGPAKNLFSKGQPKKRIFEFQFLNKNFMEEFNVEFGVEKFETNSREKYMTRLLQKSRVLRMPFGGMVSNHFGFDMQDPTGSEEIIEFCYSIPNEAYFGKSNSNKNLVRESMRNVLPDMIRLETKGGLQGADIAARLQNTQDEVDEVLNRFYELDTFKNIFDISAIKTFWFEVKVTDPRKCNKNMISGLMRTIMAGFLLEKHN